jgi:hypothetical protein
MMLKLGHDPAAGHLILAVAVLSILFTAPLGAALIAWLGRRVLAKDVGEYAAQEAVAESR